MNLIMEQIKQHSILQALVFVTRKVAIYKCCCMELEAITVILTPHACLPSIGILMETTRGLYHPVSDISAMHKLLRNTYVIVTTCYQCRTAFTARVPQYLQRSKGVAKQLIPCIVADDLSCQSSVVNASIGSLKHVQAHLLCKSFTDLNHRNLCLNGVHAASP